MLTTLEFNITVPSSFRFLERWAKLSKSDDLIFNFARYIIEICLLEVQLYKWKPSQIAASALYIARKVLKRQMPWSSFMMQQTGYDEKMVKDCSKDLCMVINIAQKNA